jgi:hypothetical protein
MIGDAVRSGVGLCISDWMLNTSLWMFARACPIITMRNPMWTGPHTVARIVMCSLLQGMLVVCAALLMQSHEDPARMMAQWICLPALCVTLTALAAFFAAMKPRYRRTFWAKDSRLAFHRRHFDSWIQQ